MDMNLAKIISHHVIGPDDMDYLPHIIISNSENIALQR